MPVCLFLTVNTKSPRFFRLNFRNLFLFIIIWPWIFRHNYIQFVLINVIITCFHVNQFTFPIINHLIRSLKHWPVQEPWPSRQFNYRIVEIHWLLYFSYYFHVLRVVFFLHHVCKIFRYFKSIIKCQFVKLCDFLLESWVLSKLGISNILYFSEKNSGIFCLLIKCFLFFSVPKVFHHFHWGYLLVRFLNRPRLERHPKTVLTYGDISLWPVHSYQRELSSQNFLPFPVIYYFQCHLFNNFSFFWVYLCGKVNRDAEIQMLQIFLCLPVQINRFEFMKIKL